MFLYLGLAGCAVVAATLVYRYDMYDREPRWLLLLTAAGGAVAMWLIGAAEGGTLRRVPGVNEAGLALLAAGYEESAKLLVVAGVATFARRHFNDPMDGIIYGSLAGLGMAVEESVSSTSALRQQLLPGAEPVRLLGHLVMGGITGFGVGPARLRRRSWPVFLLGGLAGGILLHFVWDWIALHPRLPFAPQLRPAAALGVMLTGVVAYGALVAISSAWSRQAFEPLSPRRLWGWPFRR